MKFLMTLGILQRVLQQPLTTAYVHIRPALVEVKLQAPEHGQNGPDKEAALKVRPCPLRARWGGQSRKIVVDLTEVAHDGRQHAHNAEVGA